MEEVSITSIKGVNFMVKIGATYKEKDSGKCYKLIKVEKDTGQGLFLDNEGYEKWWDLTWNFDLAFEELNGEER